MSTTLTFRDGAIDFVLEAFDRETDGEGYIVNPQTGERETTPSGEEIHVDDLAGVEKGSTIFIDEGFDSLVDHVERRE